MFAALADIIPGAEAWPRFTRNRASSSRRGCRWSRCSSRPSIFFAGMAGSRMPIAVAHGEGFADFSHRGDSGAVTAAMRFVDHHGAPTDAYPFNPNGSPGGLTAVTTADGRFTAMMPHPERVFRNVQMWWTSGAGRAPRAPGCGCSATPASGSTDRRPPAASADVVVLATSSALAGVMSGTPLSGGARHLARAAPARRPCRPRPC